MPLKSLNAIVVGAGPAGLMATTVLAAGGVCVHLFDGMPKAGRKFLLAGKGGLNLTREESVVEFASHYGGQSPFFGDLLRRFSPADLRDFLASLGVETFVGSSGRIFPRHADATEILSRWLNYLAEKDVRFHFSSRLLDIDEGGRLHFAGPDGESIVTPDAAILALGGASWPRTGSDGRWTEVFARRGIECAPFAPANCGVEVGWSAYFGGRFNGAILKNLLITVPGTAEASGYAVITRYGLEGGAVYPLARWLRSVLAEKKSATVFLDLKRDLGVDEIRRRLLESRGGNSWSEHLRKRLRLTGPVYSLIKECCPSATVSDPRRLAEAIKNLPVTVVNLRPLEEAISSAGGVSFHEVDECLMLKKLPGFFVAGEMLDWEAPTGGYLLQGAFGTGWLAGQGALRLLKGSDRD